MPFAASPTIVLPADAPGLLDVARPDALLAPGLPPQIAFALETIARDTRRAVRDAFGAPTCIQTVRAALALLSRRGIRARPLAVEIGVYNAAWLDRARALGRGPRTAREHDEWYESSGAHSVGTEPGGAGVGPRWTGHLGLVVEDRYLVDASLDQYARPEHDIGLPSLLALEVGPEVLSGAEWLTLDVGRVRLRYKAHPDDQGFRGGAWFDHRNVDRVIRSERRRRPRAVRR